MANLAGEGGASWSFCGEVEEAGKITSMKVISSRLRVSFGDNWERHGALQKERYRTIASGIVKSRACANGGDA
jgi:hypothetical protein